MRDGKVEVMYFYSGLYENKRSLSRLSKKLSRERKDLRVRLVNVEDPRNEELTELYEVNVIPVIIFFTPKGEIAARRSLPLSDEDVVREIADQISKGELPNPTVEGVRAKILEAFKAATKRNDLTHFISEQIENDLKESDSETEINELINSHVSAINHAITDLQELKKILQKFSKKQQDFIV